MQRQATHPRDPSMTREADWLIVRKVKRHSPPGRYFHKTRITNGIKKRKEEIVVKYSHEREIMRENIISLSRISNPYRWTRCCSLLARGKHATSVRSSRLLSLPRNFQLVAIYDHVRIIQLRKFKVKRYRRNRNRPHGYFREMHVRTKSLRGLLLRRTGEDT